MGVICKHEKERHKFTTGHAIRVMLIVFMKMT